MSYKTVLDFWFKELSPKDWWIKEDRIDLDIKKRFAKTLKAASSGELHKWRKTALGALAEILVLDQFSRNIFRDTPYAFAQDAQALCLTQEAIAKGFHRELTQVELPFLLMPIMHSESKTIHENFSKYFDVPGLEKTYDFEIKHKVIIDHFGRYPHRNEILIRSSSLAELEFLSKPGSSF